MRKKLAKGRTKLSWLDSYHSLSFGDYYDPQWMNFHKLRVVNDDYIARGEGFPMHGHSHMEIITYIHRGELIHRDSLGNERSLKAGDLQVMSAGSGIRHSEYAGPVEDVHLLQIWLMPDDLNQKNKLTLNQIPPAYFDFSKHEIASFKHNQLNIVLDEKMPEKKLNVSASIGLGDFSINSTCDLLPKHNRQYRYLHLLEGKISFNYDGEVLFANEGDDIFIELSRDNLSKNTSNELLFTADAATKLLFIDQ